MSITNSPSVCGCFALRLTANHSHFHDIRTNLGCSGACLATPESGMILADAVRTILTLNTIPQPYGGISAHVNALTNTMIA